MSIQNVRIVGCERVEARVIETVSDEFELAREVMEEYWSAYGYYGDEWKDAWQSLAISEDVKKEVLART